ncbi:MAG TPA: SidA/IucD/PvdA family monooxygenase [Pseudonocardiaceae bacterium]|nr:SidA/IucD/PvdA family monooxygenase [Pseudonocardiaceae bacterium]
MTAPRSPETQGTPHFHAIGIGAGPANLSLAALFEAMAPNEIALFEQQAKPGWHHQLLFADVRMQTSWLKDLVSLVDPSHHLSFLSYLVTTGRAHAFLNAQYDSMPRLEYVAYLNWASSTLRNVYYDTPIDRVSFDNGFVVWSGDRPVGHAEHLVLGIGSMPYLPPGFRSLDRNMMSAPEQLAGWLESAAPAKDQPVAVVGSGQTGAECVMELLGRGFTRIRWIGRRAWFAPLDDSPTANEFYRPAYTEHFQQLPMEVKRDLTVRQVLTSDGISAGTLRAIYQANYDAMLRTGDFPIQLYPGRDVVRGTASGPGMVRLDCLTHGRHEKHEVAHVVAATGRRPSPLPLDDDLMELMELDGDGELLVEDDFSVRWKSSNGFRIYAQNRARYAQGLPDANLSLLPMRSAMIINSMFQRDVFVSRDDLRATIWE